MSDITKMISELANLSEESIAAHESEISKILEYFDIMKSFELPSGLESFETVSNTRVDEVIKQPNGSDQKILDCSKNSEYHFFLTPPIMNT